MKYLFIRDNENETDFFTAEFETKEEAVKAADYEWNHLTNSEKKKFTRFEVLESVNPDEEAPDHFDGNSIREWPAKLKAVLNFNQLIPTREAADIILKDWLAAFHGSFYDYLLKNAPDCLVGGTIIRDFFGFSDEQYEEAVMAGLGFPSEHDRCVNDLDAICGQAEIWVSGSLMTFLATIDDDSVAQTDRDIDLVDLMDIPDTINSIPKRTVSDIHPRVFRQIVECCEDCGPDWFSEEGYPGWFHLISLRESEITEISELITTVCTGNIIKYLKDQGYSQAELSRKFFIPIRTLNGWSTEERSCNLYIRLFLAEGVGLFARRK